MEILTVSLEIIKTIVNIAKWLVKKLTGHPKTAPQNTPEIDIDTNTSLLSLLLKPLEPFLTLFTERAVIVLTSCIVVAIVLKLHLDERIGVFFIGIIFAFSGIGNWLSTNKDTETTGCLRYLLYVLSAFFILFGGLVALVALLMLILGVPLRPS